MENLTVIFLDALIGEIRMAKTMKLLSRNRENADPAMLLQLFPLWKPESESKVISNINHSYQLLDPWHVQDTIKDAMEDIHIWLPNNSRSSEPMWKNANHTEIMTKLVKIHVSPTLKFGESQTMDMSVKDIMEAQMKKL